MIENWIKCTSAGTDRTPIYVNIGLAISVAQHRIGSRIAFAGDSPNLDVSETPEAILNLK